MRIEIIDGNRVEFADNGNLLYQDISEDERFFTEYVYLGKDAEPWPELDFSKDIDLSDWNPTDKGTAFLENFLHHIAERLAVGPTTNRLTLTLSADVYSACGFGATIDDTTDIRYQIKKAIQDRNWKVTDGTNNFNQ